MISPRFILASASPTRKMLLENAGLAIDISPATIDEEEIKHSLIAEGAGAGAIAETLAEHKANSVSRKNPGQLVIGADQVLALEGEIFSKPVSVDAARDQLCRLRNREHLLISSVCIAEDGKRIWHKTDAAHLWMRDFSDSFLEDYLKAAGDTVLDGPGAYRVEGPAIQLFSRISGDYFTILGLPLLPLLDFLRTRGTLSA